MKHVKRLAVPLVGASFIAISSVASYLVIGGSWKATAGLGSMVALAAMAVGTFIGAFLGLRHHSISTAAALPPDTAASPDNWPNVPAYNIDHVADWILKIVIGVTLVQLRAIGRWYGNLIDTIAAAFPHGDGATVLAGCILSLSLVTGIVIGFGATVSWFRSLGSRPKVTGVDPANGAKDTPVTIVGRGFSGAKSVYFGKVLATSFKVKDDATITTNAPAGLTVGAPVWVTVSNSVSTSAENDDAVFSRAV